MKNFLLFLVMIVMTISLIACDKTKNNESNNYNNKSSNANNQSIETVDVTGVKEVKNKTTDFTSEAGFYIQKAETLSKVEYDNVFLKGNDTAQLDLKLEGDRKAILLVSKTENLITSEEKTTSLIADADVLKVDEGDGIISYNWEKSGFYYNLQVEAAMSESELEEIIKGFSSFAKEGTV